MKEYVYLDSELVNSYLAQIDEGILTKLVTGHSETDTNQEDGGNEKIHTATGGVGLKGLISANGEYSDKEIDKFSIVYSKSNNELIETALADYSVDVLIKKLHDDGCLKDIDQGWDDGDLVFYKDHFSVFNFDGLKDSMLKKNLDNILRPSTEVDEAIVELERLNKTPQLRVKHKSKIAKLTEFLKANYPYENFDLVYRFANYSSVLFPDTVLFKVGPTLLLCTKDCIRINNPLLTMLSQTSRKLQVLGIVLTKRTQSLEPKNNEQLPTEVIAATASAVVTDIMLDKFHLIDVGDFYIRPIALYFDQE